MKVTLPVLMLCWSALAHAALPTMEERLEDVVAGEVSWQAALPELGPLGWADPEVLQARRLVLANSGTAQNDTEDDVLVSLMHEESALQSLPLRIIKIHMQANHHI